jgi:predicted enzyme related to lactoylglutathione lyase
MKLHSAVFYSNNLEPLKTVYCDFIGAEVERETPNKFISFIFENGFRLGIKVGDKPREIGGHGTIFVEVPDIDSWYSKAVDTHKEIYKHLVEQPWGKSFSILDSDGNKIEFLEEVNE